MKITSVIARFLLGLIFLVFGLNGFFHFLSMPAPTGVAGQFIPLAIIVTLLWVPVFLNVHSAFSGLLQQRVPQQP
jgi:putative oxidoreductase